MPATPSRSIDDARTSERTLDRQETRRLERPSRARISEDGPLSLDFNRVPKGFVMEWKRHSCFGKEDTHNQVIVRQNHWTPVPHKIQPHIYGHLCEDPERHILVNGLGLYMRPAYLNEDAYREQQETTDDVLGSQIRALSLQSQEQVGKQRTRIKKSIVAGQPVE